MGPQGQEVKTEERGEEALSQAGRRTIALTLTPTVTLTILLTIVLALTMTLTLTLALIHGVLPSPHLSPIATLIMCCTHEPLP